MDATGEDWIPTQIFWRGWLGYEPEVTPLFYQLAKNASVVIDIGAHIGFFSLLAAYANPRAKIYAFEPLQRVYERLERNVELNGLTNVQCVRAALGKIEGESQFYFPDEQTPVSSSLRSDMLLATLGENVVRHVKVSVLTLDGYASREQIGEVGLIKMDTERTEHDVLAGAENLLARDRPDVICEVWPDADNIKQLETILRPHGYLFYQLTRDGPQSRKEIEPSTEALNYLFTTKEAL